MLFDLKLKNTFLCNKLKSDLNPKLVTRCLFELTYLFIVFVILLIKVYIMIACTTYSFFQFNNSQVT